jgi:hypothetical protein
LVFLGDIWYTRAVGTSWEETLVDQTDVQAGPVAAAEGLLEVLGQVPDPRDPRGVRHSLVSLLAIAIGAAESGATSWVEIGEFASELGAEQLGRLGARPSPYTGRYTPPDEATIRRALQKLDPAPLERLLGGWFATQQVMACLRNTAVGLLRLAGYASIAPATRRMHRNSDRALALLGV